MRFKAKDDMWLGSVVSKKCPSVITVILDTGATATTLRLDTVAFLIGWKRDDLAAYLAGRENVNFVGIGGSVNLVPCKLHNIVLCNELLRDFYCMTSPEDKMPRNLLGADFIGSCRGQIYYNEDIELTDLDSKAYQRRFISQCKGAHAMELWSIDSLDSMDLVTKIISGVVYAPSCEAWRGQNNYDMNTYEKELRHIVDICKISDVDALEEIIRSL